MVGVSESWRRPEDSDIILSANSAAGLPSHQRRRIRLLCGWARVTRRDSSFTPDWADTIRPLFWEEGEGSSVSAYRQRIHEPSTVWSEQRMLQMNTQWNNVRTKCFWRKERRNLLIPDSTSQEEVYLGISAAVNGSRGFKGTQLFWEIGSFYNSPS